MNKQYSAEFKLEAEKRFEQSGNPMTAVAEELGVELHSKLRHLERQHLMIR